jgi:hypothetical protein
LGNDVGARRYFMFVRVSRRETAIESSSFSSSAIVRAADSHQQALTTARAILLVAERTHVAN